MANDIERFCRREPNFQHTIVQEGLCKLEKSCSLNIFCLVIVLFDYHHKRGSALVSQALNHACVNSFGTPTNVQYDMFKRKRYLSWHGFAGILYFKPILERSVVLVSSRSISAPQAAGRLADQNGKLLCRDLLYLVIDFVLLSVKHVKTPPFPSVYLHTNFQDNCSRSKNIPKRCFPLDAFSRQPPAENVLLSKTTKDANKIRLKEPSVLKKLSKHENDKPQISISKAAPLRRVKTRTT